MIRSSVLRNCLLLLVVLVGNASAFSISSRITGNALGRRNFFNDNESKALKLNKGDDAGKKMNRMKTTKLNSSKFPVGKIPEYFFNPPNKWFIPISMFRPPINLPSLKLLWMACFLPTCLGLIRTGYTISYGYGGAMALSGLIQLIYMLKLGLLGSGETAIAIGHSLLYIFFGIRLCSFLFYRQKNLPDVVPMTKRDATIEERLKRLPLILGCATLFYFMSGVPFRLMGYCIGMEVIRPKYQMTYWKAKASKTLFLGLFGFALAAFSDWYKCYKKSKDGKDKPVTTGPFRFLRHPNYTGEMIGWTASCLLVPFMEVERMLTSKGGMFLDIYVKKFGKEVKTRVKDYVNPFAVEYHRNIRQTIAPFQLVALFGWWFITYKVLACEATEESEKKQKEKYGGTEEYENWIKSSWSGPRKFVNAAMERKRVEWEENAIKYEKYKEITKEKQEFETKKRIKKRNAERKAKMASESENDLSIPYDAAIRLAYDEDPRELRYGVFKAEYEAKAIADVIAKREGKK